MIFTERTIMVVNDSATINKPLILYRGDKNIELKITIAESQFKFRNTDASNVIETTDASYAQLVINTPYNSPIFSDVAATKNGAVIFVITEAMIDEIREVGAYEIQIRLLDDNKQSRASIPPVSNAIEIREPIAIEDGSAVDSNAVNVAKVNRALTTTSAPLEAFDSQGNYIKKTWGDGDPITDAALNKMEAGIDGVNKKVANVSSQIKDIENLKADKATTSNIQQQINNLVLGAVGDGNNAEVVQARGQYSTLNDRFNAIDKDISSTQKMVGNVFYDHDNLIWQRGFLNADGSITIGDDLYYNTKISLLGFNRVVCKKGFEYNSNYPLLLLNSNGQIVRTIYDTSDPVVINIEPGEVELHYYYKNEVNTGDIYINLYNDDSIIAGMNDLRSYDFSKLNKKIKYTNIEWTPGVFKDGQIDTTIPNFYYAYIDVSGFGKLSYNSGVHSYTIPYLNCFFDENKSFISNVEMPTGTNQQCTIMIPDIAKYFGFFTKSEHIKDDTMYIDLIVNNNTDFEENVISQLGGIKYNRDNFEWNHRFYIDGVLSNDTSSDSAHYRNCEIATKDYNKVTYVKGFNYFNKYRCCFLDSNRAFISNIMDDEYKIGDRVTVDIPENAHYFCYFTMQPFYEENNISFILSYNDSVFSKVNEIENIKKYFHERNLLKKPYNLSQRKVLFLGDSITAGVTDTGSLTEQKWVKLFTDYNNITTYYNYASSGATWSTAKGNNNYINTELNRAINDNLVIDLIIIAAGTNDYGNSLAIGNEGDIENTTVYGAINEVINLIKEHFAEAEVIFISPIPRLDISNEVYPLDDYRKAIFYKAILNGYDYVNGADFPFENKRCDYMTKTMNDGLHPSLLGHKLFAKHLSTILG